MEDLRWLDYSQRLTTHKRNTFDNGGRTLFNTTLLAGRKAMGCDAQLQFFQLSKPFDAVVFNGNSPLFAKPLDYLLPSIVYTYDSAAILGTIINGKWVVKNHSHVMEKSIKAKFREAMRSINL